MRVTWRLLRGEQAFTDTTDAYGASINMGLIISSLLSADAIASSRGEPEPEAMRFRHLETHVESCVNYVIQVVLDQVKVSPSLHLSDINLSCRFRMSCQTRRTCRIARKVWRATLRLAE